MKATKYIAVLPLLIIVISCEDPTPVETPGTTSATPGDYQMFSEQTADENEFAHWGQTIELDDSDIFLEFNTTDNDLGVQIFLDGEAWRSMRVSHRYRTFFQVLAKGPLGELGITELRFESAEPSPGEVLGLIPEGDYKWVGRSVEGDRLVGEGELSHDLLPAPSISINHPWDEVDPTDLVVTWNAPGAESVEVIIENEEEDEFISIIVTDDNGSLTISPEFLDYGAEYKLEVLAVHENGNKTIIEQEFETEEMSA